MGLFRPETLKGQLILCFITGTARLSWSIQDMELIYESKATMSMVHPLVSNEPIIIGFSFILFLSFPQLIVHGRCSSKRSEQWFAIAAFLSAYILVRVSTPGRVHVAALQADQSVHIDTRQRGSFITRGKIREHWLHNDLDEIGRIYLVYDLELVHHTSLDTHRRSWNYSRCLETERFAKASTSKVLSVPRHPPYWNLVHLRVVTSK